MSEDGKKDSVLDEKNREGLEQLRKRMQSGPTVSAKHKKMRVERSEVPIRKKGGKTVSGIFERVSAPVPLVEDSPIYCDDKQAVLNCLNELEEFAAAFEQKPIKTKNGSVFAAELKARCVEARHYLSQDKLWAFMRCLLHAQDRYRKVQLAEMESDFVRGNLQRTGDHDWDEVILAWRDLRPNVKSDRECHRQIGAKYGIPENTMKGHARDHRWHKE